MSGITGVVRSHTALLIPLLALLGCGDVKTVRVALESSDEAATADVRSLTFVVAAEGAVPQVFGPLPRTEPQAKLETAVPFGTRFFIDIFGCPDAGRCDSDLAIARGCSDIQLLEEDDAPLSLTIALEGAGTSPCPPEF